MSEIKRVLKIAALRLLVIDYFFTLCVIATVAIGALLVTRVLDAFFAWSFSWVNVFLIAGGATIAVAAIWSLVRRAKNIEVARELDERAGLKESLSTALCVSGSTDPWAVAVLETARERASKVHVRSAIPMRAPRVLPVPLASVCALVIVWFSLPEEFTWTKASEQKREREELVAVKADIQARQEKLQEALQKAKVDIADEDGPKAEGENATPMTPEDLQRAAIKKIQRVQDRLEEMKKGSDSKAMDAMKEKMNQLRQPGPGPLNEMTKALQQGDFAKAKEKLDELGEKMRDNKVSPEEKQQLQQQLDKLAQQLQKAAEDRKDLEKKLQEAGLTPEQAKQAAASPEAMQKAMENAQNLTPEQKQQLAEMAKAAQQASEQCKGMGEQMSEMAKAAQGQGLNAQMMEGMEALAGQLSELEAMEADLQAMEAAMAEAKAQLAGLCQGMGDGDGTGGKSKIGELGKVGQWKAGESNGGGSGTGGPGKGNGVGTPEEEAAFTKKTEKASTKLGAGPIISQKLVQGDSIRGGSAVQEFSQAVEVAGQEATEAIDNQLVDREWHDPIKHYFGRLEARVREAKGEAPAKPAQAGQDAKSGSEPKPEGSDK